MHPLKLLLNWLCLAQEMIAITIAISLFFIVQDTDGNVAIDILLPKKLEVIARLNATISFARFNATTFIQ